MKIAVECHSQLLQKSLELFLAPYLTSVKNCDIVVRDVECIKNVHCFYIGSDVNADLHKPFSKAQLVLALENRYAIIKAQEVDIDDIKNTEKTKDFSMLERRIEMITQEYQENILNAIKAFYDK